MNIRVLFFIILLLSGIGSRAADQKPSRLLFVGNSISLHAPSEAVGWTGNWGMAASVEEKDYVHLVVDAVARQRGARPEFRVANIAEFERQSDTYDFTKLKSFFDFQADTVILAIGENVPAPKTDAAKAKFQESLLRLLALLKGQSAAIYVRSCFWADADKDAVLKKAADATGAVFVDISTLGKDKSNYASSEREIAHPGVARHPGDQGMKAIADAIIAALEKTKK